MGLDSVELLMDVEDQFGIEISDLEAEKCSTVGEFADIVYSKLQLSPAKKCKSQVIFHRLRQGFQMFGNKTENINLDSKISNLLPKINLLEEWNELQSTLNLTLPKLVRLDIQPNAASEIRVFGIRIIQRDHPITEATISKLINWTYSLNWKDITSIEKLSSKYEVQRILIGLISEKMGIPVNRIELSHTITHDLGID